MTQLEKAREEIKRNEMLAAYVQVEVKPVYPYMPRYPYFFDQRENLITNSRGEVIGTRR